ncbi:MAG: TIGR03089 family protein [Pseudonocardiaceae bacterium]
MTITDQLLGPLLRADPARPRITHYDDVLGSRVELSGATLANWAAKTANWLRDDLDIQPGDTVAVLLAPHWQTAGVLLGVWWSGATVTASAAGAQAVICGLDRIASDDAAGAEEVAAVGLDALGLGIPALPAGVRDYTTEIRLHGDTFSPGASGPDVGEVVAAARSRAAKLGLGAGDRLLCTTGWDGAVPGEVLLAVLAADASLVQCTGADPAELAARCAAERVTVTLGVELSALRRGG